MKSEPDLVYNSDDHYVKIHLPCTDGTKSRKQSGENEDAYLTAADQYPDLNDGIVRFALADGATEASFSKEWAGLLVQGFENRAFDPLSLAGTLGSLTQDWKRSVKHKTLPWYAAEKLSEGAFATFLGLAIDLKSGIFQAVAIGDVVLFNIRKDELISSFPVTDPADFGSTPALISTEADYTSQFTEKVSYLTGDIRPGDILLLATDALAHFILLQALRTEKPKVWKHLQDLLYTGDQGAFKAWVDTRRRKKQMKNDDTTLIILKF